MKKVLSILMAALFATAMFSCGEKETPGDDNGPTLNDNNITAINDDITPMTVGANIYMGHINVEMFMKEGDNPRGISFSGSVDLPLVGTTINLTETLDGDYEYSFGYEGDNNHFYYSQGSGHGRIRSFINNEGADAPAFTSGTIVTTLDDNGYSFTLSGTLTTGQRVLARAFVPAADITED